MSSPKNQLPITLKKYLHYNTFYEITQDNITYHLTHSQMDDLKRFFNDNSSSLTTPHEWYNQLSKQKKKQVKRSNMNDNIEYFSDGDHLI
jgi:hypothetical protein